MRSKGGSALAITATDGATGVRRLTLDDPAGRNALDADARQALAAALRSAFAAPEVRAIVIGTSGRNFSTGGDINQITQHKAGQAALAMMRSVGDLTLLLHESPKPLIAAVRGHCVGAGAGLALLCDTIVCGRSARLGFPFLKLGLVADFGVTYSLPRRIGGPAARRTLLEGLSYTAEEGLAIGLVDHCVEDDELDVVAEVKATLLADAPAQALLQMRTLLRAEPATLAAALEAEALNQSLCFGSADLAEGVAALLEKRPADFRAAAARADGASS